MNDAENRLQVLVADDDPIQRTLVKSRLLKLNATTVEAEDGDIAWQLLLSGNFDLAIVDLSMPRFGGIELIQCLRGHPRTRHIPVIVITSHDDRNSIDAAFAAGASSFLVKPVVWSTFEHHIGFLLRLVESARQSGSARHVEAATHAAKETVLGNLCADAKTTAQSILQQVTILKNTVGATANSSAIQKRLNQIAGECDALLMQSKNALTTINVLKDKIRAEDTKIPLSDIFGKVMNAVRAPALRANITIKTIIPDQPVLLSCDAESVGLALSHLVQNAITHSPAGGCVSITAKCYPDGLLGVEVVDAGKGMYPDDLAMLLSPLQWDLGAGDMPRRTGFGLPLSKAIAEAHCGKLELRSMPGQGTSALFTLPPDRVCSMIAAA